MGQHKLSEQNLPTLVIPDGEQRAYYWDTERPGFGVVVGRKQRTFVVRGRVGGKLVKRTIGVAGAPRDDGHLWTVRLARQRATEILGEFAGGHVPEAKSAAGGPTLRDAMEMHLLAMRNSGCTARSIETMEIELPRLMAAWMDQPIANLKRSHLRERHDQLIAAGTPFQARRVKALVSAVWNTLEGASDDGLGSPNPASGWRTLKYTPSRERVDNADLKAWYEKVLALPNPVRRDLQLFCLFTGMRSEAARHVRWEHVDEKAAALRVPRPKGGEAKAFTLPLPETLVEMLEKRKRENRDIFGPYGGDHGWVFASLTREAPFEVQPIAEPKEYKLDPETKKKVAHLPGLHTLRRTWLSMANDAGVSELDRSVLANHTYGKRSVNETYIKQSFERLAGEQAKIEAELWKHLKPKKQARRRAA